MKRKNVATFVVWVIGIVAMGALLCANGFITIPQYLGAVIAAVITGAICANIVHDELWDKLEYSRGRIATLTMNHEAAANRNLDLQRQVLNLERKLSGLNNVLENYESPDFIERLTALGINAKRPIDGAAAEHFHADGEGLIERDVASEIRRVSDEPPRSKNPLSSMRAVSNAEHRERGATRTSVTMDGAAYQRQADSGSNLLGTALLVGALSDNDRCDPAPTRSEPSPSPTYDPAPAYDGGGCGGCD